MLRACRTSSCFAVLTRLSTPTARTVSCRRRRERIKISAFSPTEIRKVLTPCSPPPPLPLFRPLFSERLPGSPCLVESTLPTDGVGSMTMRHLAAWMFAEEVGCDWVLPNWGTTRDSADGDGTSLYCHTAATTDEEQRGFNASAEEVETILHRCSVTNWLEYFNFKATAVELPVADSFRVVEVRGICRENENLGENVETSVACGRFLFKIRFHRYRSSIKKRGTGVSDALQT